MRWQTAGDVTDSTEVIAVVMPNEAGVGRRRWQDFVTTVDEIEKQSGYDFLAKVPDEVERVIEARAMTASTATPGRPLNNGLLTPSSH